MRHHDVLVVVAHAQAARRAGMAGFAHIIAFAVEHLDALVGTVGDVEQPLGVDHDGMRLVKFSRFLAGTAPGFEVIAVGCEFMHQRFAFAVALRDIDLALGTECEIVGLIKAAQMSGRMPLAGAPFHAPHHEYAAVGGHLHHDL